MGTTIDRRQFMKLAGYGGGVMFASALGGFGCTPATFGVNKQIGSGEDFHFVQLSDSHWGFEGAKVNPEAKNTLRNAVVEVNALADPPDFIVFTGDLTHTTDDPVERRRRLHEFNDIIGDLKVKTRYFMPGEHDAALDRGKAYSELFGPTHYSFDHRGVHFIALDNVSDPTANLGDDQLRWLAEDLARLDRQQRIVVFTHRPLFDLAPSWDWATPDGSKAIDQLLAYPNVTVFYGHIHQENHHLTGHIAHHSAKSLIFPLPAPLSVPKKSPLPWDPAEPYRGLGFREIETRTASLKIDEFPIGAPLPATQG